MFGVYTVRLFSSRMLRRFRTGAKEFVRRIPARHIYRSLELLPGVFVWLTFCLTIALSFLQPIWAIIFIILFDLYWLIRILYLLVYLLLAYRRYRTTLKVDWLSRLHVFPDWGRLYHLIFLPTAGESIDIVRSTLRSLEKVAYRRDRMIIVLATEGRLAPASRELSAQVLHEFRASFADFLVTEHPDDIVGEVKGKGSNIAWAGRKAKEYVDTVLKIAYEDILVSSFDVDTQAHPQYFAYLSYLFLTTPNPTRTSYQPVPLFNNNIWHSPAIMRVAANSTTFWLMTEQVRPERLFTFSSHSMSFRTLVDVDFWQNDIVTEDSRIFLQGLLRYDGDYKVTPMYLPVSMDTVLAKTLGRSFVNLYKQQRRWAYGVENFPYMVWNFAQNKLIPFRVKIRYIWNQFEGIYSWATAPLLIFLIGWLPLRVNEHRLGSSIVAQNAPAILELLMRLAMVGLVVSAVLSTTILPPKPEGKKAYQWLMIVLQWVLFPIVMIVFGSVPATDAQTRLMLGKYLGFWVTEKHR